MKKKLTKKLYKNLSFEIKKFNDVEKTIDGVFSTSDEDRHGDIVMQNWDLKKFKTNPVILNSHNYGDITEILGKAKVSTKTGQLEGKITFASEENPKASIAYKLYKNGFANAFSVGFIPKKFDDKGKILESELLEVSLVSVPANAMALAKQKGINVDKLYDTNKTIQDKKTDGGITKTVSNSGKGKRKKDNEATKSDTDGNKGKKDVKKEKSKLRKAYEKLEKEFEELKKEFKKLEEVNKALQIIVEKRKEKKEVEKKTEKEESFLDEIAKSIDRINEIKKVETRSKSVRVKNLRAINKAIRDLVELKK